MSAAFRKLVPETTQGPAIHPRSQPAEQQHSGRVSQPASTPCFEAQVYERRGSAAYVLPTNGSWRIGRGSNNEIRLDDPLVSRRHLTLRFGEHIEVEDLGSENGSVLFPADDDSCAEPRSRRSSSERSLRRGQAQKLAPGDLLRIGSAVLVIQPHQIEAPHSIPVAATSAIQAAGNTDLLFDPEMKRIYDVALRVAPNRVSVLICGETGTGKDALAEAIHLGSNRLPHRFLRVNCAALSPAQFEAEFFGYERGAFQGREQARPGLLESADQGTLFLDHVSAMPLGVQAKLLRVLEERSVLRIGSSEPRSVDLRVIAATQRDLHAEMCAGRFRSDLFLRIAGLQLAIPPLRERRSEIEPLARAFLQRVCERLALPVPELSADALAALQSYSWPGNVRELKNVMDRAPFSCEAGVIAAAQIPNDVRAQHTTVRHDDAEETQRFAASFAAAALSLAPQASEGSDPRQAPPARLSRPGPDSIDPDSERERIMHALEQCAGNQTRAAKLLGFSRRTLVNRLNELSMPRPKKRLS